MSLCQCKPIITSEFDVPLLVARGYSSASFAYEAAQQIADDSREGLTTYVYHLRDYDPSGQDAARDIEAKLREYAPEGSFEFQQIAVLPEQIQALQLPTRPTKKSDSRSRGFADYSVELDAIPPDLLRQLVRRYIERHLPQGWLDDIQIAEYEERRVFTRMMRQIRNGDVFDRDKTTEIVAMTSPDWSW